MALKPALYGVYRSARAMKIGFGFIKDWIGANKPYKKGYWLDDWNSYSLSIRVVVWMQQFERRGDSLSEADKAFFLRVFSGTNEFLEIKS